jgi:L-threonylcarbamoyladenylate synthase
MQSPGGVEGTRIWKVDPHHPQREILAEAAGLLAAGGVIIYPTETFYGLGANARMLMAVRRIYRIKGREFSKPLPLIAANQEAVYDAVAVWPRAAQRLAQAFWPGPLTLILRAAPHILPQVHGHTGKIGIRISSHPVAQALAAAADGLLTATSANQTKEKACRTLAEIPAEFLTLADGLVDAGACGGDYENLPSTIVEADVFPPRLVRAGCVPWERLLQVMG